MSMDSMDARLQEALEALIRGEVVGVPTDTVYGLAADGLNPSAVAHIYELKGRPRERAVPLALGDVTWLERVVAGPPAEALRLAEYFWPGPLTLVLSGPLPAVAHLADERGTLAVRVPDQSLTRELIQRLGRPLALTSANPHGAPEAQSAHEVRDAFGSAVPHILDGGPSRLGRPSTIVEVLDGQRPRILRQGSLGVEELGI